MIPFSDKSPETTIRQFTREWFRLIAAGDFERAIAALDEPTSYGERWSPEAIQRILQDYSPDATVTAPDDLPPDPGQSIGAFNDGRGYWFECSVPLNHSWSDLTAQFDLLFRPSGFAVALQDIHVL
jgi:hypothetical protein